jgi:3-oxoacyl-[acyl-carrier protein] reductase
VNGHALITGAGGGIGGAIAEALAEAGHSVLLNFRTNRQPVDELRRRIESRGGSAQTVQFDVTNRNETRAALAAIENVEIDVLVNNAGCIRDVMFLEMTPDDWERVSRTALDGFFNVTQPILLPMIRRRRGRIINIASAAGLRGSAGQVNYSAAKAGLIGATRSLAKEVASRGVTVNAVAPGYIDTNLIAGLNKDFLLKLIPSGRLGTPSDVASLVRYLASEDASYVTGQVLTVDGGMG